ncbi:ABC transporter permease subunit [Tundrisphaera sp. TA3]|uniref:ABC transporter permease subunit n=1 Tax=Tundrisphaera sp. TA3 TaxID=3435775 RepID=UPI003EBC5E93
MMRWGPGPVFSADCLTLAKRWQLYAGRALLVACVLAGVALIWFGRVHRRAISDYRELATVGVSFFRAIMAVELVLALVVVPAAAAGAFCQDKVRGGLALMMTTDLSDAEIVLGRFASRLLAVLGVVVCGLPVLAITASLGGVDPGESVAGSLVVVGVAILGIGVAMTYSVWATRPHEALMATYATWAVWLLAAVVWGAMVDRTGGPGVVTVTNPFWLIFGHPRGTSGVILARGACFLAGCVAISAALALISARRLRPVMLRQAGGARLRSASRRPPFWVPPGWDDRDRALLDSDPVLWRERRRGRSSAWGRAIWRLYGSLSAIFTLAAILLNPDIATGVAGFMVSIGLLMASVTSATALAEERAQGGLDVLMAAPLSTREIVRGKWRGAFRIVPRLAILPGGLALALGLAREWGWGAFPFAALVVGLVLAYGAVVTSVGLACAAWQPRLGRAVALAVAAYLFATVIFPTIILINIRVGPDDDFLLWISPFFGTFLAIGRITWNIDLSVGFLAGLTFWIALAGAAAFLILKATETRFDRLLGRVPERPGPALPR